MRVRRWTPGRNGGSANRQAAAVTRCVQIAERPSGDDGTPRNDLETIGPFLSANVRTFSRSLVTRVGGMFGARCGDQVGGPVLRSPLDQAAGAVAGDPVCR
jgi:hypothetical protein